MSLEILKQPGIVLQYLEEFEAHLDFELLNRCGVLQEKMQTLVDKQLVYVSEPLKLPVYWTKNIWLEPYKISFTSISQAAKELRKLGAFWSFIPGSHYRRGSLIQDLLPHVPQKIKSFPFDMPKAPMGFWTLTDENTLWASPVGTSPFAQAEIPLEENKIDPPSSAYRKIQEALILYGKIPQKDEICLDAGSAPGGWTWVLLNTGTQVHSVDRAPLDPRLMNRPNLHFHTGNAFAVKPQDFEKLDWLFCDVICYPEKLYDWISLWLTDGRVKNYVVTIKMQGEPDWVSIDKFAAVPGSKIVHLANNKHELTWIKSINNLLTKS